MMYHPALPYIKGTFAMVTGRSVIVFGAAAALIFSATLHAQNEVGAQETLPAGPAGFVSRKGSDKNDQIPGQTKAQTAEIRLIYPMIDGMAAGQPAPNDLSVAWVREYFLKAQGNLQYVPFTVTFDPSRTTSKNLTVYWRVVSKDAPPPEKDGKAALLARAGVRPKVQPERVEFAFEDMNMATIAAPRNGPGRISRAFAVGAGSYDVYLVIKEPAPEKPARNAPPRKISVIRQTVDVPNLWNDDLNMSSVFVTQRIDNLTAPLTPQQQIERPYTIGTMEIVPVPDTKFTQANELSTLVMIYNVKSDSMNKPDVLVEFNFYTKQADTEEFFNKTSPQNLNAQTLPPEFDSAAGHQLRAGQAVPLASFPEGEYRLEIKVTDKLADKSLSGDVSFTVSGS